MRSNKLCCILVYSVPLSLHQRQNPAYLLYACICVCLIAIVSISKRPDSHPPSLCETKAGQVNDAVDEPGSAVRAYVCTSRDKHAASVRDTVNVFALEVLCVALINTNIW